MNTIGFTNQSVIDKDRSSFNQNYLPMHNNFNDWQETSE